MAMSVTVGHKADTHQLVAIELLLATQAADGLLVRVVLKCTTGNVDGWFHTVLISGIAREQSQSN
jgi:hypothetical protein